MTPEEKAKEMVEKYMPLANGSINQHIMDLYKQSIGEGKKSFKDLALYSRKYHAKACAIEEVKAVLKICPAADGFNPFLREDDSISFVDYYMKVLTEIEKL